MIWFVCAHCQRPNERTYLKRCSGCGHLNMRWRDGVAPWRKRYDVLWNKQKRTRSVGWHQLQRMSRQYTSTEVDLDRDLPTPPKFRI